jgi:hypothetical protein
MKHLIYTLLIIASSVGNSAYAELTLNAETKEDRSNNPTLIPPFEHQKPIICADAQSVFENLILRLNEEPMWVAKDKDSRYMLTENRSTKEWTIVRFNDEIACIIAAGIKARPVVTD